MEITLTQQQEWLLYYYNECGLRDCDRIQRSIDGDPERTEDYSRLVADLDSLTVVLPEPSEASIRRILSFA
ncbi:MAG: hypothetical protein RL213_1757 [Bacteroidota bacterium]|jgi:hypothetical protein